jgi:hypothetical protein
MSAASTNEGKNQPEDCWAQEERFGQRSKGFCGVGSKKLAYKPTMKPRWDEVSSNSGGRHRSARKIGPPEGGVAAGSPKGETGGGIGKIGSSKEAAAGKSPKKRSRRSPPLSRQAVRQSSQQAIEPWNRRAIEPSSRRAGESSSCQLASRRAKEPSSRRSVNPSIRRIVKPSSHQAVDRQPLNHCAVGQSCHRPSSHRTVEPPTGETSRRRPLNHQAV